MSRRHIYRSHWGTNSRSFSLGALACCVIPASGAKAQGSDPDIFLARLTSQAGRLSVDSLRNLTHRAGYDNQPSWSPDGKDLYFTSVRDDAQADIYRIDVASGAMTRVTTTAPESEYSATVMPDGGAISVVRVERDSAQRLWRVPLDGGPPTLILERVKPVGYHAWADSTTLALYVLGNPNTLQLADTRTGRADTVATNIGRSLQRVPDAHRVSFVRRISRDESWIELLDPETRAIQRIVKLPAGVEDYAWTPDGMLLAGNGSELLRCDPRRGATWETVADLSSSGLTSITRLAVSPRGDAIAIVAVPAK
jgi:dipeptidyl aminopeptidase/acylaminoacyl peptidase